MSHPNELQDALANIGTFSPEIQAKIRLWYPKIEAAQRKVRRAMAVIDMAYITWINQRKNYISEYDKAWKEYQSATDEYTKAVLHSPPSVPFLNAEQLRGLAPAPAPAPAPARRSNRLAAKPRVNYEEEEDQEAKEAAKEAERLAKEAAKEAQQMRRAEFHKRVAAIPRPNPAAYNASVANFKARNLWQERWSHEPHSQDYINHRAIKNEYRAAIAAYNERIAAESIV